MTPAEELPLAIHELKLTANLFSQDPERFSWLIPQMSIQIENIRHLRENLAADCVDALYAQKAETVHAERTTTL